MTGSEARATLKRIGISQRQLAVAIHREDGRSRSEASAINRVSRAIAGDRVSGELALAIRLLECVQTGRDLVGR